MTTEGRARLLVAFSFVASRVYAYAAGLRFEGEEWQRFWHFADPKLLREELAQSIYYLHSQPPLPNLTMGISVKLFGSALPQVYTVIFLLLGVMMTAAVYLLMRRLRVTPWIAAVLTSFWCASPAMLLFENFLFYTYPVLGMLVGAALALHTSIAHQSKRATWAYLGLITTIVLTRALFHPIWLLAALAQTLVYLDKRRNYLLAVCVPLVLVGGVMLKNKIEFDHFSLSSWRGMNIGRAVLDRVPDPLRTQWIAEGKLSPWAKVGSFKPLNRYPGLVFAPGPKASILGQIEKSNRGPNFHHWEYLQVSRQLELDARFVIGERPGLYLDAVWASLQETMYPAASYRALKKARGHIAGWEEFYNFALSWKIGKRDLGPWPVLFPILITFGLFMIWRSKERSDRLLWIFMLGTILWVVLVGAMAERTENARFRFLVDPFLLVLVACLFTQGWQTLKDRSGCCVGSSGGA
jgi:hypothetical protein